MPSGTCAQKPFSKPTDSTAPSLWWNQLPKFSQPLASIWTCAQLTLPQSPLSSSVDRVVCDAALLLCPHVGSTHGFKPKACGYAASDGQKQKAAPVETPAQAQWCIMAGQMDALSLLSLKEIKVHLWKFHQWDGEGRKKEKKRKAKGFQRRQPLERFPDIKEKGLQSVLLIWYLCSPPSCPQAWS